MTKNMNQHRTVNAVSDIENTFNQTLINLLVALKIIFEEELENYMGIIN